MTMQERALQYLQKALNSPRASFHEQQWESIEHLLNNRKLLVVERTGWGKSMVYFLATRLMRDNGKGPTLLISPLLSLMRNQMDAAGRLHLCARSINSTNAPREFSDIERELEENSIDVLLISPERLANEDFRKRILPKLTHNIGLLVIDEAHCISDWGHDFRPDYRRIIRILQMLPPNIPVLATTATANNRVMTDIRSQLGQELVILRGSLVRSSLRLQNIFLSGVSARLAWLAQTIPRLEGSGIVYTLTVRDAVKVSQWLQQNGINAKAYYSSLKSDEDNAVRETLEKQLIKNEIKVLVATVALGMGFDKPDLGFVIHFQRPASVVHYYQQVGRAGRAIPNAHGVLLCGEEDEKITDYFIQSAFPAQKHIELLLNLLNDEEDGLTKNQILARINITKSQLEKTIKFLTIEYPSPLSQENKKYYANQYTSGYKVRWETVEAITELRKAEQRQMNDYIAYPQCLMNFLQDALNDTIVRPCGKCRNCNPSLALPATYDRGLEKAARNFLFHNYQKIPPKLFWIIHEQKKAIPEQYRSEEGRALCAWRDGGWGDVIARDKYERGFFSEPVVHAFAKMIREWSPSPMPEWVTCIPSLRHPVLVPDFARRVAFKLNLPFKPCILQTCENKPQKSMENEIQQINNLREIYKISAPCSGACLLLDDIVNSGWTLTAVSALLRRHGCSHVFPAALALNTLRID
ncbi:RecQ family ATP-dependent DNA helicase [uncultured Mailhella sp.]|uniref:RecQ family ATP-dependent DNA helicase n=1 Tax=uncultured Mailhella sp. TaxID=1981031 RepID=UPI0025F7C1DF|nr:RecQ family ATP-dependent DNA helicase [uncultured Mailhella sp.]